MQQELQELKQELIRLTDLKLEAYDAIPALESALAVYINELILHHFDRLIQLLYRIDVSEPKLKLLLKENPGQDAGLLIARMIIERQLKKIETRKQFRGGESGEEKW